MARLEGPRPAGHYFQVTAADGLGIHLRRGPCVDAERTGQAVRHGEVFGVSEVLPGEPPQAYLRLADGRGWVFTHSGRTGAEIATELSWEEAMAELDRVPQGECAGGLPAPASPEQVESFRAMVQAAGLPPLSREEAALLLREPDAFGRLLRAAGAAADGAAGLPRPPGGSA